MKAAVYDVVVVGGGPAGLVAATRLAETGASVALIEEAHELGGQYYKRREGAVRERHGDLRPRGTQLIKQVRHSGVHVIAGTSVWGVGDAPRTLLVTDDESAWEVTSRAIVIATGAHERSLPFLGWQKPGVVTPGLALHLAAVDRVAVGRRAVVAGTGPFLLPVACALLDVGVDVVAVVEANRAYRISPATLSAVRYPSRLLELGGYISRLARARVPMLQGWSVEEAIGGNGVERVVIHHRGRGTRRSFEVDTIAVAHGFRANVELPLLLGVRASADPVTHELQLERRMGGRTSADGVYIAGEVIGIAGAHAAELRGECTAAAVAVDLGLAASGRSANLRAVKRRLRRVERFAALNERLFPPQIEEMVARLADEAEICRCEGVTAGRIRQQLAAGLDDMSGLKGGTRVGMGLCQGRQCSIATSALVAGSGRVPSTFTPRMPIKPVRMSAIRNLEGGQ